MSDKITQSKLFDALGPLPLMGRSWPKAIAGLAWLVILLIIWWIALRAQHLQAQVQGPVALSVVISLLALCVIAYYMWFGRTTIDAEGIKQEWIFNRRIGWEEIRMAKFVPLLFSKRLVCFPHRGRPVIFHAGERPLEIAFAHIALAYSSKNQP